MKKVINSCMAMLLVTGAIAAEYDWHEGTNARSDGATRDYYNRHAQLPWRNFLGDWEDADGKAQGDNAYAAAQITDNDTPQWVAWDITALVKEWAAGTRVNKGLLIRHVSGSSTHKFRSKEYATASERPQLEIFLSGRNYTINPEADTYLETSTYRGFGDSEELRVSGGANLLLRFDSDSLSPADIITRAELRLYDFAQYGSAAEVGVFACSHGHEKADTGPTLGIADNYNEDNGIANDPDVIFFCDFESATWEDEWSSISNSQNGTTLGSDPTNKFESFMGKAVRSRIPAGSTSGMTPSYAFARETGSEPEEIYWRYYHRFGDNWNPHVSGGKMPGISGTYGVAGWGGRKVDGTDGWSARGNFGTQLWSDNPLAPKDNPLGWYCYHADMPGTYGDVWRWIEGYGGFLENNRWYCIDQYCKMNTVVGDSGQYDGILRAWVDGRPAFEKTDIRFRHVTSLKIEKIWMNVYHGGTDPTPENIDVYFDNVVIARKYIGPAKLPSSISDPVVRKPDHIITGTGSVEYYNVMGKRIMVGSAKNGVYLILDEAGLIHKRLLLH